MELGVDEYAIDLNGSGAGRTGPLSWGADGQGKLERAALRDVLKSGKSTVPITGAEASRAEPVEMDQPRRRWRAPRRRR